MPEMNGYEVCQRLRMHARSKDVPVVFLTALTDTADKVRAFDAGGVDYVIKPFQFEEVLARFKTHVALRRAQAELADRNRRLRDLEQLRDDLVGMVVHDMRSPLTALRVKLRLLQRSAAVLGHDHRDILQAALQSTEALNRMANDLLDVSRLEECRMPIERVAWDLTQRAHDVCSAPVFATPRPAAGCVFPSSAEAAASESRCTIRGAASLQKPEPRSSRSSAPSRLGTTRPTTLPGWDLEATGERIGPGLLPAHARSPSRAANSTRTWSFSTAQPSRTWTRVTRPAA
jgi:CheY-like chemotaxis protein